MRALLNLESHWVSITGSLVNLIAAITIGYHAAYALLEIVRHYQTDRARLILADGVLAALAFSVVGTLLKAIALQSWSDIGMFAFVLVLRTLLKQVFLHERNQAAARTAR